MKLCTCGNIKLKVFCCFLLQKKKVCVPFFPFSIVFYKFSKNLINERLFVKAVEIEMRKVCKECTKFIQFHYYTVKGLVGEDLLFVQVHMPATKLFCQNFRFFCKIFKLLQHLETNVFSLLLSLAPTRQIEMSI